jgi:hypothetical protein
VGRRGGGAVFVNTIKKGQKSHETVEREYEKSVDPDLVRFIEDVRSAPASEATKLGYSVSKIGDRQRKDYERLVGASLESVHNFWGGDEIIHTDNRHGIKGKADHSMADINDMARIGYVLNHYDHVGFARNSKGDIAHSRQYKTSDSKPSPMLLYVKKINGFHIVTEAANDSKNKRLNIISTYKSKNNPLGEKPM